MKKLAILAVATLLIGGVATTTFATDDPFTRVDGNRDGQLSMSEVIGGMNGLNVQLFNKADADGNGWLDESEFLGLRGLSAGISN